MCNWSNIPVRDKVAEFTKSLFVKLILKKILSFSKGPEDINDVHCWLYGSSSFITILPISVSKTGSSFIGLIVILQLKTSLWVSKSSTKTGMLKLPK